MTETLVIPNPPTTKDEAIACLTALGPALKTVLLATEANLDWVGGHAHKLKKIHDQLNEAGYSAEDLFGVPDGTFGAGGTTKPNG